MSASPYFSIVVPTYNRAKLVAETLATIFAQEFTDFEVLVVDDGSTDNTEEVLSTIRDPRFQYHKKQNGERGAARNYGAKLARGQYINFFDSDDWMYPNHLTAAKRLIEKENAPEFFHLGYDFKSPDGQVLKLVNALDATLQTKAMFDNILSCNGVFVRRDIALQFPFEENRVLASAEDWELWIRLLSRFKIRYSNEITTSVVSHDLRSIHTIPTQKVIPRDLLLIDLLKADEEVRKAFGNLFGKFVAERYTFIMLCLGNDGQKKEIRTWAKKAMAAYPAIVFSRRFLASVKKSILG